MPVQVESAISGPYTPNGVTTTFAFTFKAGSSTEVAVVDQDGNALSSALFSVDLDNDEGGSVTFSVAPSADDYDEIYIISDPSLTQTADFDNTGSSFNPASLTRALDRAAIRDLKQQAEIDRSIKVPFGEAGPTFPTAAERVDKYLAFGAGGEPVLATAPGSDVPVRSDLASTDTGKGAGMVVGKLSASTAIARTLADKAFEFATFEDFGAVGYDSYAAALAGTDSTTAIQEAIDWAYNSGSSVRFLRCTGAIFQCGNITLRNGTTIFGSGRQVSGFAAKPGTTGKWFSADNAQKICLADMVFYGGDETGITHILELLTGQHGTEGFLRGLWLRSAPEAYGLYIDGNVSFVDLITIQDCKYGFYGRGGGNKAGNIGLMQIGADAATPWDDAGQPVPGTPRSLDIGGWDIDKVHIEAAASDSIPIRLYRGDCHISSLTVSPSAATSHPVLIETDNLTYTGWSIDDIHILNPGNLTFTESGWLRYGNPDTSSWTYTGGTSASSINGRSLKRYIHAREGLELKYQQRQAFMLRITKDSSDGIIKHRLGQHIDSSNAGTWSGKINGASTTLTATPTGADASTAFAAGAKISSVISSFLILDTAAQTAADLIMSAAINGNNTGTAYAVKATTYSSDVNGTTRNRLALQLVTATGDVATSWATALGTNGFRLDIRLEGYLA